METNPPNQKPTRRGRGGPQFHKPGCKCNPCKGARRRAEATESFRNREQSDATPDSSEELAPKLPALRADEVFVADTRTQRDHIANWIKMRAQGMRNVDIAPRLGLTPGSLNTLVSKATREGWLKFDSPAERLEHELAPLIVDNIKELLIERDPKMTIEAAKGIGLFKSHQAVKVESDSPQMSLTIEFKNPDTPLNVTPGGNVLGKPRLPSDIIEVKPE